MKIAIGGPTYSLNNRTFDAQRCVNLMPFLSETGNSKSPLGLQGTPGLELFAAVGDGPIRGCIASASGRSFWVSGDTLYEVGTDATVTNRGTLNTATGTVSIAENGPQIMLVDGTNGYIFTLSSDAFAQIADGDFPNGATTVTFMDQYFVVNKAGTGRFHISNLLDGTAWEALDFATAESMPDDLVAVVADQSELWLGGKTSLEVYYNSGDPDFPFERIEKGVIASGVGASHAFVPFDNSLVWLERDIDGRGRIMRADGYRPERISTQAIEELIDSVDGDLSDSFMWTYQNQGHDVLVVQIKGLNTTIVYDAFTRQWHERQFHDTTDNLDKQHLGSCHASYANNNLVGDRLNGRVYKMRLDVYTDNGELIHRERIIPHMSVEDFMLTIYSVAFDMETGVGLVAGQGVDPQMMVQASKNKGRTFGNERFVSLGKIGEFEIRVRLLIWGASRNWSFKLRITDPVKVFFNGWMYINEGIGSS